MSKSLAEKVPKEIQDRIKDLQKQKRYLYQTKAKPVLKSILELGLSIQEMEEIFGRKWGTLKNVFSYHKIPTAENKPHRRYSDDSLRVVVDCYRRSRAFIYSRDAEELNKLKEEMFSAVKSLQTKIGDENRVTLYGIKSLVKGITYADLKRIGCEEIKLPLKWGKSVQEASFSSKWSDVPTEIQSLGLEIKMILDHKKPATVAWLSQNFNVSKKTIIQVLDFLKKYYEETEGTTILVSEKIRGTVAKTVHNPLEKSEDAFPGFDQTMKILVLSHPLLGSKYQQLRILETVKRDAAKAGVKFAVVIGGIVAGKPKKGTHGEFFILDPDKQIEYAINVWPKMPFKTYVLAGDEDLSWGFNQAEAICRARKDLRYLGAWSATRPIEGTDVSLEFVFPREGVKRTYTVGYRPQRHSQSIITALFPKIRKEGIKNFPRVIFNGRVFTQGEFNRGLKSVLCPGLISQTPSMAAAEIVPSVGAVICELKFDKNRKLLSDFDEEGRPRLGGVINKFYDYTPYCIENDYGEFPEFGNCTPHEQRMLTMLEEKPCTEGEVSRSLNCSVETVRSLFKSLQDRGFKIVFSETTKRMVWLPNLKTEFKPLDIEVKGEIIFGTTSDAHFGSKFQQPTAMKMVHDYAVDVWRAKFMIDAGDAFAGRKMFRGQESEVFAETFDEQLEEGVKRLPKRLPTYIIGGNHDESFWKQIISDLAKHIKLEKHPDVMNYFNIMRQLSLRRPDIIYLCEQNYGSYPIEAKAVFGPDGMLDKVDKIKSVVILITHPSGGASRFRSYKGQKYLENLLEYALSLVLADKDYDIPQIYILGHWHINAYLRYGGVDIYLLPCFESQSFYLKAKGLTPDIGSWMVKAEIDKYGYIIGNTIKYLDMLSWVKKDDY